MLQEALEIHDYLNPALWTKNDELLPEVEDRLNKIVSKFQSECMLPLDIVDVHLVGSNASYNYNKYSDLDVHIVVNFDLLDVDKEILTAAYNLQKAQFNRDYDISIHGVNVEMYIEDINAGTMSNGIYSLYNKKWIKKPQKIQYPKLDARFDETVKKLADKIEDTLQNGCSVAVTKMINMLYMMRKNALTTDGEFGVGNLIFKEIRNLGLLDQLKDRLKELQSQDLTLEDMKQNTLNEEHDNNSEATKRLTRQAFATLQHATGLGYLNNLTVTHHMDPPKSDTIFTNRLGIYFEDPKRAEIVHNMISASRVKGGLPAINWSGEAVTFSNSTTIDTAYNMKVVISFDQIGSNIPINTALR